ncbi:MAG: InlB B-repeat-containing protein, partial [Treponema sp.]|nr:InlB B-repeat-containing protein [Treponema sp.]
MKNKCFLLGIFSMLLIFSFLIMGCDEEIEDTYYTVTFNNNGGTGSAPSSQTVLAGSAITLPSGSGLSRSGHNFGGWNVNAAGSGTNYSAGASYTVNSNITLYARWVSTSITITLPKNDYADHSSLWQCIYDESSLLNGTRIMTGDVYVFNYSFRSNRNLDRLAVMLVDTTATAGYWTMLSDNFVIGVNIPANTDITGTITFAITTSATSTARAANALVFQAGEGTPSSPTLTFSSFVFGKPGSSHTVTFNSNGGTGTVPSSQTVSSGSSITLPGGSGLTRSGFTFGGWNTNASGTGTNYNVGATYTPTGNVTLYAKWDVIVSNNYTVTFNNNGGTGTTPSSQTVPNGTSIILPSGCGLSRSGYTFAEWNTNSAGTGTNYSAGSSFAFNSNVTLYARWNAVTTVTFNSNGGSSVESQTVNSGSIATRPADPTRTGFTFDNWYSNSGLTDVYNFSTPVTSNITLYAKWNVVTTT